MEKLLMKFGALAAAVVLTAACGDGARTTAEPRAGGGEQAEAGLSGERFQAVQELMDAAVADGRITAGIALVARDGKTVWLGTTGEMEPGIPMRDDAILPLASVGKMFTATAAMILYERGTISLDDPVSDYIPEFANARVEVVGENGETALVAPERPITVFDLLTHTGGLTVTGDEFWAVWDAHTGTTSTTTRFARALIELPLFAHPGEQFRYGQTGASYEVLGAVIEIASEQTLEEFMSENIFGPLGLEDSYFTLPAEKSERLPAVYRNVDGTLELDRPRGEDFPRSTYFHGGGGVRSAPGDILRFARLFLEGGSVDGVRILRPETVAMMMTDQLGDRAPDRWKARGRSWGFGAAVRQVEDESGSKALQQYGWVGGGFAKLWVDPGERLIAYFNSPLTPPGDNDLLDQFEDAVETAVAGFESRG